MVSPRKDPPAMTAGAPPRDGLRSCPACGAALAPWRVSIGVCRACGTASREPEVALPDRNAHYAGYYDAVSALSPLTAAQLSSWARSLGPFRKTGRILEIGCGAGHFLRAAQAEGYEAWGTEVSTSGLARLRAEGFRVLEGDLPTLRLAESSFDAIILFEVIEHLPDPGVYLVEARRLLRDGGALLLTTPNFDSLSRRLLGDGWRVVDPEHLVLFTTRGLRGALQRAGLRVSRVHSRNVDPLEILRGLRKEERRGDERQSRVDACRAAVASRPWLRVAKGGVNGALRLLKMGDTLEAWAHR